MGLRLRLKAGFSLAGFHGQALVVLRALKRYGLIVADNGSSWYITGAPDPRWNDEDLDQLKQVPGSAFEAVAHRADPTPGLSGRSGTALRLAAGEARAQPSRRRALGARVGCAGAAPQRAPASPRRGGATG